MTDNITLPRSVVEQALEALFMYKPMVTGVTFQHGLDAMQALRAALEQPQVEQEPAPNGATHRQPKQGAFYKRVDGKWYTWSLMKNGEPHRWYISPGTAESCLEPLAITPKQKRDPPTDEQIDAIADAMPGGLEGFMKGWGWRQFARAVIEATHNIK